MLSLPEVITEVNTSRSGPELLQEDLGIAFSIRDFKRRVASSSRRATTCEDLAIPAQDVALSVVNSWLTPMDHQEPHSTARSVYRCFLDRHVLDPARTAHSIHPYDDEGLCSPHYMATEV